MFFNPAMAVDRDLEVALVRALADLGRPLGSAWEMTAATGARGLRAFVEGPLAGPLALTDAHPAAVAVLGANAAAIDGTRLHVAQWDAKVPLATRAFDFVDLDPYGSPLPWLPAAFAAAAPGALLAVTATDMRVLAGAEPGAALRRYGGRPIRGRLGPESGLRLLLASLDAAAAARGASIAPRLAYVGAHHVRAYVDLRAGRRSPAPIGTIDPAAWTGPPIPGPGPYGPLWLGPLFDAATVGALRPTETAAAPGAIARFIAKLQGELACDVPFFYETNTLARSFGLRQPPRVERLRTLLHDAGFRTALTHARAGAFRTDAQVATVRALAAG